jgi:hypothetical protein
MKNRYFIISFMLAAIISMPDRNVVITGTAGNAKAGAVVIADEDQRVYYLNGLASWDNQLLDKKVQVKGRLKEIRYRRPAVNDSVQIQFIERKTLILQPVWELVK